MGSLGFLIRIRLADMEWGRLTGPDLVCACRFPCLAKHLPAASQFPARQSYTAGFVERRQFADDQRHAFGRQFEPGVEHIKVPGYTCNDSNDVRLDPELVEKVFEVDSRG